MTDTPTLTVLLLALCVGCHSSSRTDQQPAAIAVIEPGETATLVLNLPLRAELYDDLVFLPFEQRTPANTPTPKPTIVELERHGDWVGSQHNFTWNKTTRLWEEDARP